MTPPASRRFPARRAFAAAFVTALAFSPTRARADEATDLEGLLDEPVVTTASKTAETGSTAPATSTLITAEDLRRWGVHTLDEAIDFLSLGAVTSNPLTTPEAGARGVLLTADNDDHFLLLVDGHAVNEPLFGSARLGRGAGIPLELVDHIEVILGPGSVLYGSNAMLGVINVVTRKARELPGAHAWVESEVARSYRVGAALGEELTLFGKKGEITASAEYFTSNGPNETYGPQNFGLDQASGQPSRFTHGDASPTGIWGGVATHTPYARVPSALVHVVLGDFELFVRASTFKRAVPYRARYINNVADFDDADTYELDRNASLDLVHHARLSPVVALSTRLYADTFDYQRYLDSSEASGCLFAGVGTCRYSGVGVARWVGLELQSTLDWRADGSFVTLLGVDERVRQVGFKLDVQDFDTGRYVAPTSSRFLQVERLMGAYLQQTWTPLSLLSFNAGARLDLDERFARQISPRLAVSVKPWENAAFKAIYSEAFRSPSYFESTFSSAAQILPHDLHPERVRSIEGSLEQKVGTQRLLFGVFRSWWTDLVELHVLTDQEQQEAVRAGEIGAFRSGLAQFRNVSSLENYGLNAAFDGTLLGNALRYGATFTAAYARRVDDFGSNPLVVAPQVFGNARVAYELPGDWPSVGLAVHWMGRRVADRAFDGGFVPTPVAPPFAELRATIAGDVPHVGGLSYRLSANYAFATRGPYVIGPYQSSTNGQFYTPVPELVPMDRFRVTIGLRYDFSTPGEPK